MSNKQMFVGFSDVIAGITFTVALVVDWVPAGLTARTVLGPMFVNWFAGTLATNVVAVAVEARVVPANTIESPGLPALNVPVAVILVAPEP